MNREETAHLLTAMASFDRRTLGPSDVIAWQRVVHDVDFADGIEAVQRHYAEHTDWMMPAHVRRIVRDIERERAVGARKWAPGQYGVPKDEALPEIEQGGRLTAADVSPAVLELLSQLRAELPDAPRERLFPRRVAWEREQRAYQAASGGEPNPHYRPRAADPDPVEVDLAARIADCRTNSPHDSGSHIIGCPEWRGTPEDAPLGRCAFCGVAFVGGDALNPEHPGGGCR